MNITFILGNGFDLQLGLNTSYSDFLKEYTKASPNDNENIKLFKSELRKSESQELWSDAEKAMGIYLGQYSDSSVEAYSERILDFERNMAEYLRKEQARCSFSSKDQIERCFKDFLFNSFNDILTGRKKGVSMGSLENNYFTFISLNYTNLLEQIQHCCLQNDSSSLRVREWPTNAWTDSWDAIYHVHGMLGASIIMGVNDESQLDLSGGVTLTDELRWELIKPILNHSSGNDFDAPAKKAIAESDIIAIYGVSYGATDKMWWDEIVKWLKTRSGGKLIAYVRDQPNQFDSEIAWTESTYEARKKREILKKLLGDEEDPDFNKLLNRVYIILNTERLNLKEFILPSKPDADAVAASSDETHTESV